MTRLQRRLVAAITTFVLVCGVAVAFCSFKESTCEDFTFDGTEQPDGDPLPATVLLVDVADSRPAAAKALAKSMEDQVRSTMTEGGRLVVVSHGGFGQPIVSGTCFPANRAYLVENDNDQRRTDEIDEATELLTAEIRRQVRTTEVVEIGSVVALLEHGREVVDGLRADQGTAPGDIDVILRSDLLGNAPDCLDITGLTALPEIAADVVQRCLDVGQLRPFPDGVGLSVDRTGEAAGTGTSRFSRYLVEALCPQLAAECTA